MIKQLSEHVFDHLVETGVDERVIDIVLAALDGEDALTEILDGGPAPLRPDSRAERVSPQGAFLTKLTVQGFRGIGGETVLNLPPGPGLTVIAGRNGSGKSSLSEALECALTGTTVRWDRKLGHAEFRSGWRNLHHGEPCEIALTLNQVGQGEATVRVTWPKDATDPGTATTTYQVAGQKRERTDLGWQAAIQNYRPLLSYDDLGLLLTAKPSELHDSIARALALDELEAAVEQLRDRSAPMKAPLKRAGDARKTLRAELTELDDERAKAAVKLLAKTTPNLAALKQLATGPQATDGPLQICQRILAVELPSLGEIEAAAAELQTAQANLTDVGEQRSRTEVLRDQLLSEALAYHAVAGDSACPVCDTGRLDASWKDRTQAALTETDLLRGARNDAEQRNGRAESRVRELVTTAPAVLSQTDVNLPSQAHLVEAWGRWVSPSSRSAEQLLAEYGLLADALAAWQDEAQEFAASVTERWAPYALRLARLVEEFAEAIELNAQAGTLDAAYTAALNTSQHLRAERLHPIVDRTKSIWSALKQESNVTIEEVELTGKGNRRAVDIRAVVDDASGSSALSVMSQGELNSLALALYLPRATSDESPFRFLVLDDPVQAMDPTKVDGLAAVLGELARTRQVIVFSHDDRFAQAAQRLTTPPTVLSVRRGSHSEVIVQSEERPADRHLNDAHAILRESRMDESVKRRVLPGVLRHAIEAAAWQRYSAERLRAGDQLNDLERSWHADGRTRARLALLLGPAMEGWLGQDQRRRRAVSVCNTGAHQPMSGDLSEAYDDSRAVVNAIQAGAR